MNPVYLVGVDGSNCGSRAIQYAKERAQAANGKVLVAYVIEWSKYSFSTPQENEQRHKRREEELARAQTEVIDPIVAAIREEGIEVDGIIRHGNPAETLDELAREHDVTTIIVGRRGSSRFKMKVFGSVSGTLVQIADRPVSVVP